ncbi:MAG: hypothetical protein CMG62_10805 [Candidatus Marinimicrobia bacterium]|nr:hypothetical protein [Candidatus Neomarinimicrobiota bacterium]|tara:strand:+ start:3857 stop:5113 length:1257 start_codon:yes stop_codon:yes gene_type:complete
MKKFIFFVRAYNDLDHFAPLIWKCIKEGDLPTILITTKLKIEEDYRYKLINKTSKIKLIYDIDEDFEKHFIAKSMWSRFLRKLYSFKRDPSNLIGKIYRKFFFKLNKEINFLRDEDYHACIFEWSTPYARGDKIEKYFIAAKALGITTFALPHGCNIFVNSDVTEGYRATLSRGKLVDQSSTRLFDYYIFQNPLRRDGWVKWGFDAVKAQAWGSLRFYPDWARKNLESCPKYEPEIKPNSKLNVVFMQFQKEYNIDNVGVLNFLKEISNLKEISLVVKDATREGKSFYNQNKASKELGSSLISWVGNEVHSPSLVDWSDVVIVIGGSIGIEAMLQSKPVIYPKFLSSNKTLYEKYNAAYCTSSSQETTDLLERMKEGNFKNSKSGIDLMIKEIVYAGKEEYDVLQKYYDEISSERLNY